MFEVSYYYGVVVDGCGCCSFIEESFTIYNEDGFVEAYMNYPPRCYDDEDVMKLMAEHYPQYPNFTINSGNSNYN